MTGWYQAKKEKDRTQRSSSSHLLQSSLLHVPFFGGDGGRFGDYLCVDCTNMPRLSGRNKFTNTKFTRPITKISKSSFSFIQIAYNYNSTRTNGQLISPTSLSSQTTTVTLNAPPSLERFKTRIPVVHLTLWVHESSTIMIDLYLCLCHREEILIPKTNTTIWIRDIYSSGHPCILKIFQLLGHWLNWPRGKESSMKWATIPIGILALNEALNYTHQMAATDKHGNMAKMACLPAA